jgi:GT2 family glycosyltransferase
LSPNDSNPQHVVTAVIVAHDGAVWLPHGISALQEQTRPVQRVVAVDTGSRDRSGSILSSGLGHGVVFGMDRPTGYAAAVRRAVAHRAASAPVAGGRSEQVEWLWLLHDDCEPAPDALEQLLRGAAETPTAAVLGPKLKDWADRDVILEAGLAMDTVGRRITGIEPREVDQGQHDGDRDALAVSSAGMLVRRDVWEQVNGFDPGMLLFGEDIDFCWRVHSAGYRVRVITDAVVYHAQAASKGRRRISVGRRARLLERRNGLLTLLGNLPRGPLPGAVLSNLMVSLLRTLFFLVAKRPAAALDESAAVGSVLGHPLRLAQARRRRARGRRAAYSLVRGDLPQGHSVRRMLEYAASLIFRSAQLDTVGSHHASDDPMDDDSLLVDTGFVQRVLTRPGFLFVLGLLVVAGVAERAVITGGTLGGGMLLPAWEGSSSLWGEFLQSFHPSGVGSASFGAPYVAIVALLATVLLGKVWLAVDVLLLGCVPLAGLTAVLALRHVTTSVPVRLWAAASYALLPVAFGAIAAGRLGTAVAFAAIPLLGLLAGRMFTQPAKIARRAAWAVGLTLAVGASFVPLLWLMALVGAAIVAATLGRSKPALLIDLAIAVLTPFVLLMPWLAGVLAHPSQLLLETGVQQPGLSASRLPGRSLLLLSPGGPGLPPYWVSGALLLVGLLALLSRRRRLLVVSGWCVALLGFAVALGVCRTTVTSPGGQAVTGWPGVPLAVAAAGLILAAAAAADALTRPAPSAGSARGGGRGSARGRAVRRRAAGLRGVAVVVLGLVALSAPGLAAANWLVHGVSGPISPASGQVVPSLVSVTGSSGRQVRTLVLSSAGGHVSYLLLRGASPQFADPSLTPAAAAQAALGNAVAALVAPNGGDAVDQSQLLANFDIGFVLMRPPISAALATRLDGVAGLTSMSMTRSFDLWKLTNLPARVSVVQPDGAVVAVASGPVGVSGARVPSAGGTLELAEPAGGWTAALNGHALTQVASPAGTWAQAFRLPRGGGILTIGRSGLLRDLLTALELILFVVVAALALPGVRTTAELEAATSDTQAAVDGGLGGGVGAGVGATVPEGAGVAVGAGAAEGTDVAADAAGGALVTVGGEAAGSARAAGPSGSAGPRQPAPRMAGPGLDGPGRPRAAAGQPDRTEEAEERAGRSRLSRGIALGRPGRSTRRDGPSRADEDGQVPGAFGPAARRGLGSAAAGSTRNARDGARGPGAPSGSAGPRAAWPAGQPTSRFIGSAAGSYAPEQAERGRHSGELPVRGPDDSGELRQRESRPGGRGAPSPAGTPYDEPAARPAAPGRYGDAPPGRGAPRAERPYPPSPTGQSSPPGDRYRTDTGPGRADYPQHGDSYQADAGHRGGYPRDAGYPSAPAARDEERYRDDRRYRDDVASSDDYSGDAGSRRGAAHRRRSGLSRWGRQQSRTERRGPSGPAESDLAPRGSRPPRPAQRADAPAAGRPASGRPASGRPASGRPAADQRAMPPDARQSSTWPTQDQHGWSEDYQADQRARPEARRAPPQAWEDRGEPLEALPPAEVHHDPGERGRRAARNWPEPEDDAEGDSW